MDITSFKQKWQLKSLFPLEFPPLPLVRTLKDKYYIGFKLQFVKGKFCGTTDRARSRAHDDAFDADAVALHHVFDEGRTHLGIKSLDHCVAG